MLDYDQEGKPTGKCLKTHKQEWNRQSWFCTICERKSNSLNFMVDWVEE